MARTLRIGIIAGFLGVGAGLVGAAAPAKADCVRAEVVVYWSDGTEQTIWPQSHCFLEIGPDPVVVAGVDRAREEMPSGTPSGGRVGVWVPLP